MLKMQDARRLWAVRTVSEPLGVGRLEIRFERRAESPSYCVSRKSSEKEEQEDRAFVRPRQVRYQALVSRRPIGLLLSIPGHQNNLAVSIRKPSTGSNCR
jgi:hypothetical protein